MRQIHLLLLAALLVCFLPLATIGAGCTNANAKEETQKEIWTCPMHPNVLSDKPGNCPICGMTLVRKKIEVPKVKKPKPSPRTVSAETIPEGHAPFQLSFERQQMIGVKTGVVEKGPVFKTIRAVGRLAFDPELYAAQNEFIEALRHVQEVKQSPLPEAIHAAQHMVESSTLRLKVLGLSDDRINKLKQSGRTDSSLIIGTPGADAWIYAEIYEADLPTIKAGLSAEISATFLEGKTLQAQVDSVDRIIDPISRTAKVRLFVRKPPESLRPQSYVDVTIKAPLRESISVPFDAVLDTGTQAWVFVAGDEGHFEPRRITIGNYLGSKVAIASGLVGGERIVTSANFLIDSESRLQAVSQVESNPEGQPVRKTPSCPENQYWDVGMSMCMPKVGK